MVAALLFKSSWRFHRQHPLQLVLSLAGIILGVGIVTSVLITNHSAVRAFSLSSEALYGKATHQIVAANGLPDEAAAAFIKTHSRLVIAPVIESDVALNGELATLIGLDPFREAQFARLQPNAHQNASDNSAESGSAALLNSNYPLWASEATAQRMDLTVGDTVDLNGTEATLTGLFSTASRAASDGLLVTDISVAQTLGNKLGSVDRLELILDDEVATTLASTLPAQWRLQATTQRQSTMKAMTRGFQINLTAMSLLALLVGMFLIHNTMTFAVLQRREVFATKRLVGISTRGLFSIVIAEAFVFSAVASIVGLIAGIFIAGKLLALTTQTINDLYFVLHVQQIHLSPWVLLTGLVLGIGSSILATILAAREAASDSAANARRRSAIEEKTATVLPWLMYVGLACLLIGAALAWIPSQSLMLGFAALMIVFVGYGLSIPWLSQRLLDLTRHTLGGFSVLLLLALGSLTDNMSRTGLAIAALTVAVAATLGVDLMTGSFRHSVDTWLQQTLQSDLYITFGDTDGTGRSRASEFDDTWLTELETLAAVEEISTGILVELVTNFDTFDTLVLQPSAGSEQSYEWIDENDSWNTFLTTTSVMVSEPMANKYQLSTGSDITLFTETEGDVVFKVAGVYRDYGSSHGRMVMNRSTYDDFWSNPRIGSIGINVTPGAELQPVIDRVRHHLASTDVAARVRDNISIHRESLDIFDRTFAVTRVLRWLTMGVAFIGIFSALLAMHLERARDFAVMRASGGSRIQLRSMIMLQSIAMGITAGLLAIPLGWMMSEMLIHIINVRSFGWSMNAILPRRAIPETLALALGSAALACVYPAWRLGRHSLVDDLRTE